MLKLERTTVVEDVTFDEAINAIVVHVHPGRRAKNRCGICGRRAPLYDRGDGRRRWRALDLGPLQAYLEAEAPRVQCPEHGVIVAQVPWARHAAGFTYAFEDMVSWLAAHCSKSAVQDLMRIAWRSVGRIVTRVVADAQREQDRFADLTRIGIDEISYKRGQNYLTVVVDHDTGRLIWAAPGRSEATLRQFFDELGKERSAKITMVTADAADWIRKVVQERCQNAELCLDPFHIVSWATDALDEVRRLVWNDARFAGQKALARELKDARFALWKNPEDLTERQQARLALIAKTNAPLYRAYLLKEQLRQVFQLPPDQAMALLDSWIAWAQRSRLKPFQELARKIRSHRQGIENSLRHDLSNAIVESVNTKIRLITRVAFGFHSPVALIALAMLGLGGCCPALPHA
jgi:transposase